MKLCLSSSALGALVLGAQLVGSTGCATLRSEFTPPTGEPLGVYDHTRSFTYNVQVETGGIRDAQGRKVASVYRNETRVGQSREWYGLQGEVKIDDESFYRIAGDQEAIAQYDDYHEGGVTKNTVGIIMGIAGGAVLGLGIGMFVQGNSMTTTDQFGITTPHPDAGTYQTVGYVGMLGGAIIGGVGLALTFTGRKQASTPSARIIHDPGRLKRAAEIYNGRLSAAPEPVVTRQEEEEEGPPPPPPPPKKKKKK